MVFDEIERRMRNLNERFQLQRRISKTPDVGGRGVSDADPRVQGAAEPLHRGQSGCAVQPLGGCEDPEHRSVQPHRGHHHHGRPPEKDRPRKDHASYNENLHLTSLWFFYASLVSLYTGSFESTVENHLNSIKELTSLEEYKRFILSRVEERLTNDYFDITLIGSEGLAVSGRGNNAWNAYVAALNILNAKILFSKSNLLVSKLFEPGTDGKGKSLEKHHLFPKAYLKTLGYNDAKINQMANYAFIDWKDNMEILDEAPSIYYPVVCEGRSPEEIQRMEEENALPYGWENMPYEDFLIERRKLMAAKIKAAFEQLKKNVE